MSDEPDIATLDQACIALNELYESLQRAGFCAADALHMVTEYLVASVPKPQTDD